MRLSEAQQSEIASAHYAHVQQISADCTFEDAAQGFCDFMYKSFEDSIVLTRIFISRPFMTLPQDIRSFAEGLGDKVGIRDQINEQSPILSLAGTKGREADWSHRKRSNGHIGIPLVSSSFVKEVPMLMGLLLQMFGNLDWLNLRNYAEMSRIVGKSSGVFYIDDAKQRTDDQGRKIIAAQDFVEAEDVRTVFGVGGGLLDGSFITLLCFTREDLDSKIADSLVPALTLLRATMAKQITQNNVFHA